MNIDSVISTQLHFVVYSIWLHKTHSLLSQVRSHHNVYLDTSINEMKSDDVAGTQRGW